MCQSTHKGYGITYAPTAQTAKTQRPQSCGLPNETEKELRRILLRRRLSWLV